jgi:Ca2+/Na+ antiporter
LVPRNQRAIDLQLLGSFRIITIVITIVVVVVVVVVLANPSITTIELFQYLLLFFTCGSVYLYSLFEFQKQRNERESESERERGRQKRGLRQEQSLELNWVAHRVIVEEQFWFAQDTIC